MINIGLTLVWSLKINFLMDDLPRFIREEITHVPLHERLMAKVFGLDIGFIKVPQNFLTCIEVVCQAWGSPTLILISFIFFPLQLSQEKCLREYHGLS